MSTFEEMDEEDSSLIPLSEEAAMDAFAAGCARFLVVYLICYVALGIASSIAGAVFDSGWLPFFGWSWPLWATIIILGVGAVG